MQYAWSLMTPNDGDKKRGIPTPTIALWGLGSRSQSYCRKGQRKNQTDKYRFWRIREAIAGSCRVMVALPFPRVPHDLAKFFAANIARLKKKGQPLWLASSVSIGIKR